MTVYEDKKQSPNGTSYQLSDYEVDAFRAEDPQESASKVLPFKLPPKSSSQLVVCTSVATWCPNCLSKIQQLNLLRKQFSNSDIEFVGIPIDESDTDKKLDKWLEQNRPPYQFLRSITSIDREKFSELVIEKIGTDVLPATVIANTDGKILNIMAGTPTVSDLRQLLAK